MRLHPRYLRASAGLFAAAGIAAGADWLQWGGPNRNFEVPTTLAPAWPEQGPRVVWDRELGDGYSAILVDGRTAYTMYRRDGKEVLVALDTASGQTRWEADYDAPLPEGLDEGFGVGPRSTPLIDGDRIYTLGIGAKLNCFNIKTGQPIWGHDLLERFGATIPRWGYSASPLLHDGQLIVPVGGDGKAVMAFDAESGSIRWGNIDAESSYSSPILIELDGRPQLIVLLANRIVGLNPADGAEYWSHPHETMYDVNATTPLWLPDRRLLIVSSAYNTGTRVLQLAAGDEGTKVEELWYERRLGVQHGMFVRRGDLLFCSVGMMGPGFIAAADLGTGEMLWRKRFPKATLLAAGPHMLMLGEDGVLALARPDAEEIHILAEESFLSDKAWTVPTLVDHTLYMRDRQRIVAVSLP